MSLTCCFLKNWMSVCYDWMGNVMHIFIYMIYFHHFGEKKKYWDQLISGLVMWQMTRRLHRAFYFEKLTQSDFLPGSFCSVQLDVGSVLTRSLSETDQSGFCWITSIISSGRDQLRQLCHSRNAMKRRPVGLHCISHTVCSQFIIHYTKLQSTGTNKLLGAYWGFNLCCLHQNL